VKPKMKRKTKYCDYWLECDRDEDCFNGEYCPVQKYNSDLIDWRDRVVDRQEEWG
jgi:hypothetical protein